jgi:hypothetical protein
MRQAARQGLRAQRTFPVAGLPGQRLPFVVVGPQLQLQLGCQQLGGIGSRPIGLAIEEPPFGSVFSLKPVKVLYVPRSSLALTKGHPQTSRCRQRLPNFITKPAVLLQGLRHKALIRLCRLTEHPTPSVLQPLLLKVPDRDFGSVCSSGTGMRQSETEQEHSAAHPHSDGTPCIELLEHLGQCSMPPNGSLPKGSNRRRSS